MVNYQPVWAGFVMVVKSIGWDYNHVTDGFYAFISWNLNVGGQKYIYIYIYVEYQMFLLTVSKKFPF